MTIEFYHLLFSGVIEVIRFFSFNHTMWCITLIDYLFWKASAILGQLIAIIFYSEFLFYLPVSNHALEGQCCFLFYVLIKNSSFLVEMFF